jgi:hypothetical protein
LDGTRKGLSKGEFFISENWVLRHLLAAWPVVCFNPISLELFGQQFQAGSSDLGGASSGCCFQTI